MELVVLVKYNTIVDYTYSVFRNAFQSEHEISIVNN